MTDASASAILARARKIWGDHNPLIEPPPLAPPAAPIDPVRAERLRRLFHDGRPPRGRPPHPQNVGQLRLDFGSPA